MPLRADILDNSFYSLPALEAADLLASHTEDGLTKEEAAVRSAAFGTNVIEKANTTSWLTTILRQFNSPLIILLILAAGVTLFIGEYADAIFILAAVLVNAGLGWYQEHKADKALSELKTYLRQRARVIRDGIERDVDATELVPGDLIRLAQGDRVAADARLLFANDLEVDEALLTGESLPVEKSVEAVAVDAVIGDQRSMVFAGTLITQGVGTAVVSGTGLRTELGKIALLVGTTENEETPLQVLIRKFSTKASIFLGGFTAIVFVIGLINGLPPGSIFLTSVALAVSAVPEGLPIAMTVILAIGVQRMARRRAVVRKLSAAEALGSTDIILTDKTGTLTTARMAIGELLPEAGLTENALLQYAVKNAHVLIENPEDPPEEWRMDGKIVETALIRSAGLRGIDVPMAGKGVTELIPFNSVNKFSVSRIEESGVTRVLVVGAPDILLAHCDMTEDDKAKHHGVIEEKAGEGSLMLGVAYRDMPKDSSTTEMEHESGITGLTFAGLIALRDPIRENVPAAIQKVEASGIRVVLISGDHRGTAVAVARAAGININEGGVFDAAEFRALSPEALAKALPLLSVVARVSPEDKMKIAQAFQAQGLIVAMTGDGVNDAPSIKQADIGIAMGSGTAVARDVADLVLLDDNFETIAAAVEEGRQIMANVRKVLVYLLSDTTTGFLLVGGSIVAGIALPLNALQILWINFFADSLPAVAFAFEKEHDHAALAPHSRENGTSKNKLFDPLMNFLILFVGSLSSVLLFILYFILLNKGYEPILVSTFIFACFGSYALYSALAFRSLTRSIFSYSLFSNPMMLLGVGLGTILILGAIYLPPLQSLLYMTALPLQWLLGVVAFTIFNLIAIECAKWEFRTMQFQGPKNAYAESATMTVESLPR